MTKGDTAQHSTAMTSPQHLHIPTTCVQVEWKLARGTWRPRLLGFAQQQDPQAVLDTSTRALAHLAEHMGTPPQQAEPGSSSSTGVAVLPALKAAMQELGKLKVKWE